jgi:hypothetical protein
VIPTFLVEIKLDAGAATKDLGTYDGLAVLIAGTFVYPPRTLEGTYFDPYNSCYFYESLDGSCKVEF